MLDSLQLEGKLCVEVGVKEGEYSEQILARKPQQLFLVDPWITQDAKVYPNDISNLNQQQFNALYDIVRNKFEGKPVTLIRDFSHNAAGTFDRKSLDFVYIDAVHTFESCFMDMCMWYHTVKQDGWMCGHDYTGSFIGVKQAVEAFTKITGKKMDLMTLEPWASWGIRKTI